MHLFLNISEFIIFVSGVASMWMVNQEGNVRRWASIVRLLTQPFWIVVTVYHKQWSLLALTMIYTVIWGQAFYKGWIKKQPILKNNNE